MPGCSSFECVKSYGANKDEGGMFRSLLAKGISEWRYWSSFAIPSLTVLGCTRVNIRVQQGQGSNSLFILLLLLLLSPSPHSKNLPLAFLLLPYPPFSFFFSIILCFFSLFLLSLHPHSFHHFLFPYILSFFFSFPSNLPTLFSLEFFFVS